MGDKKDESPKKTPDATLSTIADVAKACGVSKSTAARRLKELDLPTVTDLSDGRGRQLLPPETASALASALAPSTAMSDESETLDRSVFEAEIESYRKQIASLERQNEQLADQIEKRDAAAVEAIAAADRLIDELKHENERLREDLALSRRLEGFHWPWTRDKIKAQHLLPTSTD